MSLSPLQNLGPLYLKLGLQTSPEIVASRVEAAEAALARYDELSDSPLIRGALGIASSGEMSDLADILNDEDATISVDEDDVELGLIASGILDSVVNGGAESAKDIALKITTASFGGVRQSPNHEMLVPNAAQNLATYQQATNRAPSRQTFKIKPKHDDEWDEVGTHAASNHFNQAHSTLKTIVDGSYGYAESGFRDISKNLNAVIDHQRLLDEQMQVHWWIVDGYCEAVEKPYANMDSLTASAYAGLELASLTKSRLGLSAAKKLLDIALKRDQKDLKSAALLDAIKATPLDIRSKYSSNILDDEVSASLVPIHLAFSLSVEAGDGDDWFPRFKRISSIDIDHKMTPVDFATQLYLEQIMLGLDN